jgi:hypothetical protein
VARVLVYVCVFANWWEFGRKAETCLLHGSWQNDTKDSCWKSCSNGDPTLWSLDTHLAYKSSVSKVGRLVQDIKLVWSICARDKTREKVMFLTWCLNYHFIFQNCSNVFLLRYALYSCALCKLAYPCTLSWPFRHKKWHWNLFENVSIHYVLSRKNKVFLLWVFEGFRSTTMQMP